MSRWWPAAAVARQVEVRVYDQEAAPHSDRPPLPHGNRPPFLGAQVAGGRWYQPLNANSQEERLLADLPARFTGGIVPGRWRRARKRCTPWSWNGRRAPDMTQTYELTASTAPGGEPGLQLEVAEPGKGWNAVVLMQDEAGALTWHFPPGAG